ncbi:MAG: hypothetical protein JNL65_07900 [Saprospiraceae bacterium]|nr:hypothetical protein [Saprospiraceae bacterium]
MNARFLWIALCLMISLRSEAQNLILKGRLKCILQKPNTTKGAENVVIVPNFIPPKSTITASAPSGYFEINTDLPFTKLEDKTVTLYAISKCKDCNLLARRIFITEDNDRQFKEDQYAYCTIKDWVLDASCQSAEFKALKADSVLRAVVKQEMEDLDKVSKASALVGTPSFLNFISSLVSIGSPALPVGFYGANSIVRDNSSTGQFLLASSLYHSANTGFNFCPYRELGEAVFWNPAAIQQTKTSGLLSLFVNFKNNYKASIYYRLTKKFSMGMGFMYTKQDAFRTVLYRFDNDPLDFTVNDFIFNLKESALNISPSWKLNDNISIGCSIKSVWQKFNNPSQLFVEQIDTIKTRNFSNQTVKVQNFDADLSVYYKINRQLSFGVNLMNLTGSQLYGDAFISNQKDKPIQNQRAYGLGILYKLKRVHVGSDMVLNEDGLYDASIGINYVPFNNTILAAGFSFKQAAYTFSFKMKHFHIAYINDNNFLAKDVRKSKIGLFNGNLFTGFSLNFGGTK